MTDRRWTLLVALLVDCDLRTAQRIVQDGPDTIRFGALRDRASHVVARRKALEKVFAQIAV